MNIGIIGTRGIPAKYGGFETFAQELSIRLVERGVGITVYCDKGEVQPSEYKGVKLLYINLTKSENPLLYYYKSVIKANKDNDIVLICGAGGTLFTFYRIFSRKVIYITNIDGIEHLRNKWSFPHKLFVEFCEYIAVKSSNYIIADSSGIQTYIGKRYNIKPEKLAKIEYGAYIVDTSDEILLAEYNLISFKYYLIVSRLEPENNVDIIIEGYIKANLPFPLVVVGNLLNTAYVEKLRSYNKPNILFIGGVYDKKKLQALRYYCKSYLHGHSVGGTNPSLLEALGCKNIVIAHDNVFNREVTADRMFYFKTKDECANALEKVHKLDADSEHILKDFAESRINDYYNWDRIAEEYLRFFLNIIKNKYTHK